MSYSIFGQVTAVRKFVDGDIEIDFYHEDDLTTYRHSSDPGRLSNFPKELIEIMIPTLATDVCIEIFFGDDGNPTSIEMEECGDEDDEEFDDDLDE